jgi:uncharacterized protein (DUF2345 family)
MQLIAAQGDTTIQAQSDIISLKAKNNLDMKSAQASIDFAAATNITLRTAGGASIKIAGGNITVMCPGKILVQAGQKSFTGGTSLSREMNTWPTVKCDEEFVLKLPSGKLAANRKFEITRADGTKIKGVSDAQGKTGLQKGQTVEGLNIKILPKNT